MRKFLRKIFIIITFILCFCTSVLANELGITSVVYDDSSSFLAINSFDNEEYQFAELPKLHIVEDEHKVYFDIKFFSSIVNSINFVLF